MSYNRHCHILPRPPRNPGQKAADKKAADKKADKKKADKKKADKK